MTAKELIKELKKLPPNTIVAVRDHDQDETELNCFINRVTITDFEGLQPNMWNLNCEVIVLSS